MPKQKNLTAKERKAIQLVCAGETQTDAIFHSYDCKNKQTASSIATRVFKRPQVKRVLDKGLERTEGQIVQRIEKSIGQELALAGIDKKAIVEKFKELLYSNDKRIVFQMIDMFNKLGGLYAPEKRMLIEQSTIYAEIKELPEEGIIERPEEEFKEKPATKE